MTQDFSNFPQRGQVLYRVVAYNQRPLNSDMVPLMSVKVLCLSRDAVPPTVMSNRFRHEIAYFGTRNGDDIPVKLGPNEYWIDLKEVEEMYDEGVVKLVSPLDSSSTAEVELSEELEMFLEWVIEHKVNHVRLESS